MKKILIVDDNEQNLYMLQVLLETNGYEVEQASNGIDALEKARVNLPDMIVSDVLMPSMDGFRLCRIWKNDDRLNKIPFVFYTATYTDPKDSDLALSLGAERFIVKPVAPEDFLANLQEVFEAGQIRGQDDLSKPMPKEEEYYKEYSEALIRKLEHKMEQLEQANKRVVSLYQASCDLATTKSSVDLIHGVLRSIVESAGYQRVLYFQFDKAQNRMLLLDGVGFSEETIKYCKEELIFEVGEVLGLVGLAAQNKQIINIADTSMEPSWIALDKTIHSGLFVPVYFEKLLLGVFALFSTDKGAFSEEDERNIAALANSLAISIVNGEAKDEILQLNAQLEQRVSERTAELETSNRELEAFAYSVSHDLRAPLRAIDGFAHILSEDYRDSLDAEGNRLLDKICNNSERMDRLITDLLALSKVSRSELRFSRINMYALVNTVYHETISPDEQERCTFKIDTINDAYGDSILMVQVWSNLIANAIKYSLPKDTCFIQISSRIEGKMTVYSIKDNGVGFAPEFSHKLFGLFQRLHDSDEFEGTGIGLAIVKRIIERHGGQVWAEGTLNQGATFSFSLPAGQK